MTHKQLMQEFRLVFCSDRWGCCMAALFEATGRMYMRGLDIPDEWEYSPGLSPTDPDCYWHEVLGVVDDEVLVQFATTLQRYSRWIHHHDENY